MQNSLLPLAAGRSHWPQVCACAFKLDCGHFCGRRTRIVDKRDAETCASSTAQSSPDSPGPKPWRQCSAVCPIIPPAGYCQPCLLSWGCDSSTSLFAEAPNLMQGSGGSVLAEANVNPNLQNVVGEDLSQGTGPRDWCAIQGWIDTLGRFEL